METLTKLLFMPEPSAIIALIRTMNIDIRDCVLDG
jgi:hypothetical protein